MKASTISITLALMFLLACKSTLPNNEEIPDLPANIFIDLDEDGKDDFLIYSAKVIYGSWHADEGISSSFKPLGTNEVLVHYQQPHLFLQDIRMLNHELPSDYQWIKISGEIAGLTKKSGDPWPTTWAVPGDESQDSYIIGVRLNESDPSRVGWIELSIDQQSGKVSVLNKEIL